MAANNYHPYHRRLNATRSSARKQFATIVLCSDLSSAFVLNSGSTAIYSHPNSLLHSLPSSFYALRTRFISLQISQARYFQPLLLYCSVLQLRTLAFLRKATTVEEHCILGALYLDLLYLLPTDLDISWSTPRRIRPNCPLELWANV